MHLCFSRDLQREVTFDAVAKLGVFEREKKSDDTSSISNVEFIFFAAHLMLQSVPAWG